MARYAVGRDVNSVWDPLFDVVWCGPALFGYVQLGVEFQFLVCPPLGWSQSFNMIVTNCHSQNTKNQCSVFYCT